MDKYIFNIDTNKYQIDITGQRFGRLTAIRLIGNRKCYPIWGFKCDCGKEIEAIKHNVIRGNTSSCGCLEKEIPNGCTHRESKTRFYQIWQDIKRRCLNVKNNRYHRYGGRGIKVCDKWLNFLGFKEDMYESYLEHVKQFGERETTIERISNDGNYEKGNCKYATRSEQCLNRRSNYILIWKNNKYTVTELSKKLNLNYYILYHKIKKSVGMCVEIIGNKIEVSRNE